MSNTRKATQTAPAPSSTDSAAAGAVSSCPEPVDLDSWIDAGGLATRTIPICIRGDLQAERERIAEQIAAAGHRMLAARQSAGRKLADPAVKAAVAEVEALKAQLDAVEGQMRAHTKPFEFRALTRDEADDLMVDQPPRKGNERDERLGYNVAAVRDATIRFCTVEPKLTEAQWDRLWPKLNAGQLDAMYAACDALTYELVRAPFTPAASETSPSSGDE